MKYYVGIDIGTSSAKVLLMDENGNVRQDSSMDYTVLESRPGWKEIEPETWMQAVEKALNEILQDIDRQYVESIGVTGQMHTVVMLDKEGRSVRPALMWNDTRTSGILDEVKDKIRLTRDVAYIANVISTGSPAINLYWFKKNEPERFKEMKKFLIGPDYIVYRLTGKYQTDYCEASTSSLFDLNNRKWSSEIREILGFPGEIYPEVKGSGEVAGTIKKKWADKFGLRQDVKVMVGTGDNPAAAISTGCFAKRYPVLSLGTSGVLMVPKDKIEFDAKGKNILFSIDGKTVSVLVQGVVQSCGNSFAWWTKNVLQTDHFDEETKDVNINRLGESSVIFYPHLTGDKTIYANPHLRGGFLGIGTECSRRDMTIAVMEGICFGVKQLAQAMGIEHAIADGLRVIGGGSKNDVWMQILADVLNVKIIQLKSTSGGAGYGIALTAAVNAGTGMTMEDIIKKTVVSGKEYLPRKYNVSLYEKKYKRYIKIYEAMEMVFS